MASSFGGFQGQQSEGYVQPGGIPGGGGVDPQIASWFQAVDQDRTGQISARELQQALTNSNWTTFNMKTCQLMIGMFDQDRNGQINLPEFAALWQYIQQWRAVFDSFDRDRSGAIDANELHTALNQMGYRLSPQFAQLVVSHYDQEGRRGITLDSFIQACISLKSITDMFRQKDTKMEGVINISYEEFLMMCILNK